MQICEPFNLRHEIADVTDEFRKLKNPKLTQDKSFWRQLEVSNWEKNWILVEERFYLIKVSLMDVENNFIELTENLRFSHKIDESLMQIVQTNPINSEVVIKALKLNQTVTKSFQSSPAVKSVIKSSLSEIVTSQSAKYKFNSDKLRDESEITITSPVKINHPTNLILLPLVQDQVWQLSATGGSGFYHWNTKDQNVAFSTETASLKPYSVGKTILKLEDSRNPNNFAEIEVEV